MRAGFSATIFSHSSFLTLFLFTKEKKRKYPLYFRSITSAPQPQARATTKKHSTHRGSRHRRITASTDSRR